MRIFIAVASHPFIMTGFSSILAKSAANAAFAFIKDEDTLILPLNFL